jgi:hypothetical protein
MVDDILLDARSCMNIMTKELRNQLRLPNPKPTLYTFQMANQTITKPIGLITDLKIRIHGIPYIAVFMVMKNNVLDSSYSMLLDQPWLRNHMLFMIGEIT